MLPRLGMGLPEIRDLIDGFMFLADIVEPTGEEDPNPRDPKDQPVPLTLLASKGDYLINGDKDLLVLADRYPILAPAEFWSRHGA